MSDEVTTRLGVGMTISDQLSRHSRDRNSDVAFVYGSAQRTYGQLDERVNRLANALRDRGVGHGDRVVVLAFNTLEVVESYFAAARLGAICVPVNFRLVADEVAYVLRDSEAAAVIVHGPLVSVMEEACRISRFTGVSLVFDGRAQGFTDYEEALASADADFSERSVGIDEPAFIMYTSGTTGSPKGAVLTHYHLLMQVFSFMVHSGAAPEDRTFLAVMPLFHVGGLMTLLPQVLLGGRILMLPYGTFDPVAVVEVMERERVTSCVMVPTQLQAVCEVPDVKQRDLSALRRLGWGAAPASTRLLQLLSETFPHVQVESTFGQTECGPITTMLAGKDQLRKLGSVGLPMLNVEIRIVDDEMNDVSQGEVGEIVYRTPMVMKEYWNNPEATAEAFRGGWFHSGDLVRQDEDGYIFVVDRKNDMIISGGENIYCAEVENVLASHPEVSEVALVGIPDDKWGETPLAVLTVRSSDAPPTAGELNDWCIERLARYKRPRRIAIVPMLPRNSTGKVLKNELRVAAQEGRLIIQFA